MVEITRSSIIQGVANDLAIMQNVNATPKQLSPTISPVFEVGPKITTLTRSQTSTTTGSTTLYTTLTDKDFFITAASLSFMKDAACDVASGECCRIQFYQGGALRTVLGFASITATADSKAATISFKYPVKVDRNTAIAVTGTFTAGVFVRNAIIHGYILE